MGNKNQKSNEISILHTSDLHLSDKKPATLHALKEILKISKKKKIDILTIGGDLFDSALDANILRPKLRKLFSGNDFEIIAIPGNHDIEAYEKNLDFGSDITIFTKQPFEIYTKKNLTIVAVPFTEIFTKDLYKSLRNCSNQSDTNILLIHCTLDIDFSSGDFGSESQYCSVSSKTLSELGFDFIFAGHFHKSTINKKIGENSTFIYPGSPISLTKKELGRRNAILYNENKNRINTVELDTFYRDRYIANIVPGKEKEELTKIENWINTHTSSNCELEIFTRGYISKSEKHFGRALKEIVKIKEQATIENECENISEVLKHPLYSKFKKKLEEKSLPEHLEVDNIAIKVISELLSKRELRK